MASNSFGSIFRITTWGESHGKSIGVVIDGCPAGVKLCDDDINAALVRRAGGGVHTTPRKEADFAAIHSGVFGGVTTGAPISIIIPNVNADSSKYESIKDILRPGHANYTYLEKYGVFDYRGGGRASARETACRVAAGAVAQKLLQHFNINVVAHLRSVSTIEASPPADIHALQVAVKQSAFFVADTMAEVAMDKALAAAEAQGDSLGGVVEFIITGLPVGFGDPVYEKLEANLGKAMLTISASKGFEIGSGFAAATMRGSEHNDAFVLQNGKVTTCTNHAGGTLGGISSGLPVIGRVAFKPTSSIMQPQDSVDVHNNPAVFMLPEGSRHDPCVAIRAVPVVEAMCWLVLADALLLNRICHVERIC